jgi:serine/threonine protein kinase
VSTQGRHSSSTHWGHQKSADTPIEDNMVAGTLVYMAPEQILSDPIDARADIYSFGIVLFRWLTAELPFDTGPMLRLFAHHLESAARGCCMNPTNITHEPSKPNALVEC